MTILIANIISMGMQRPNTASFPERSATPRDDRTGWERTSSPVTITADQVTAIKAIVTTEGLTWAEARQRIMGTP